MNATAVLDAVPLAEAVLCQSCQTVTRAKNGHCPICGASTLVRLTTFVPSILNEYDVLLSDIT
jgi:uncharacterized paraquat-inducible protein A